MERPSDVIVPLARERKVAYKGFLTSSQIMEAMNFADKVLSISEGLKLDVVNLRVYESKVYESKVNAAPDGIDTKDIQACRKKILKKRLTCLRKEYFAIYGSPEKNKDLYYLVEAAKSFVGTNTDLHMIDRDDGLIKSMEKSAEELGIASCVKFTGPVNHEDNSLWISAADLLVLPPLSGGRQIFVLETLSYEVSEVATDVG